VDIEILEEDYSTEWDTKFPAVEIP
jgi:hypothetical protein